MLLWLFDQKRASLTIKFSKVDLLRGSSVVLSLRALRTEFLRRGNLVIRSKIPIIEYRYVPMRAVVVRSSSISSYVQYRKVSTILTHQAGTDSALFDLQLPLGIEVWLEPLQKSLDSEVSSPWLAA